MSYELARRDPDPNAWAMIQGIAQSAKKSGKLGVFNAEEAQMKMLVAYEYGLPLTSAYSAVHMIENKPTLSPKTVLAKILVHPDFGGLDEQRLTDDAGQFQGWSITLRRKSGLSITRAFTLADAQRAGLATKQNWKQWPENMCYWRAMGFAQDVCFADVTLGLYRSDELGAAVTADGDVIAGSWQVLEETPAPAPAPAQDLLQSLVALYGAQSVMDANGGQIPTTLEALNHTAAALQRAATDESEDAG